MSAGGSVDLDRVSAAIPACLHETHELRDVVAGTVLRVEAIDFRRDEADVRQQLAGGFDSLRLVLDAEVAPIDDGADARIDRLHDRHERVGIGAVTAVILGHRHHADGAAELDELLVGVGGDRQIQRLACPAADVGAHRRRAERGGDAHAVLDLGDRLRTDRRIGRRHLTAELEVDELHADLVGCGPHALGVGDGALVEVVDDDLELGQARAPRARTSARRAPSSPPAPAPGRRRSGPRRAGAGSSTSRSRSGSGAPAWRQPRRRDGRREQWSREGDRASLQEVATMHRHVISRQ